jgi:glycosyltransferase involved in cell wall biosynthesis
VSAGRPAVVIVHDHLVQCGGAERVVLAMLEAFPGAPIITAFYEPDLTYPEFGEADVRPMAINRSRLLRHNHRVALPFLPRAFSALQVDADVVLCSSAGWAHGVRALGRKVAYWHRPARWLYQPDAYLASRGLVSRAGLGLMRAGLLRWDRGAAATVDRHIANSRAVAETVASVYGADSIVLPPPVALDPSGPQEAVEGLAPGYFLCVARLVGGKNVDAVLAAFASLPEERLVVVGDGDDREALAASAPPGARFLGEVSNVAVMRWLYDNCAGLVAAGYEGFGLTPVEAGAFGKPSAVLRWGGYLDSMEEGRTGVFFDRPEAAPVAAAVRELAGREWSATDIRAASERYSLASFVAGLQAAVGG